ncbi:MAG: plasmid pRiA4b ORF-3 family protein, partial [Anaerolineae bacterium]
AMLVELFAYLETAESPRVDDPALLEVTESYGEWQAGWLERTIPHLTAPTPTPWQPADFGEAVDADQWRENLHALLLEFVADRRRAGVPLSRGYIAYGQLGEYLSWQFSDPAVSDDTEDWPQRGRGRKRKGRRGKKEQEPHLSGSLLVPRHALLDRFLTKKFHLLGSQPYEAVAIVELLPAYLHFLARLNLIHPTEMDEVLEELSPLVQHLPQVLRSYGTDLVAVQNVTTAWTEETLATLRGDPTLALARATPPPVPLVPSPAPAPQPGALGTYTFKVTYLEKPDVWRTIEVTGDQTLDDLHYAIQRAVSFDADHLYSFFMSGQAWDETTEYASPHAEGRSAAGAKIRDLGLRLKQRFLYLFDYGDEHRFEVQLVAVNPDAPKGKYPRVVERHGRNPKQYQ